MSAVILISKISDWESLEKGDRCDVPWTKKSVEDEENIC